MRTWFCKTNIREIGYCKLVDLERYDSQILPYFMSYWRDFTPLIKDLIIACFPVKAHLPNDFQYDQALQILKTAYDYVEEHQAVPPSKVWTPKRASDSFEQDFKKGRHL
jgi:hypothetical protein